MADWLIVTSIVGCQKFDVKFLFKNIALSGGVIHSLVLSSPPDEVLEQFQSVSSIAILLHLELLFTNQGFEELIEVAWWRVFRPKAYLKS
ncbi:hypothetical protein EYC80_003315 [Monilinia laxa]|uniref:Uncharacterized protein n=1 Tax=Monilinia laxa TaxID=61186 RepID=A0A5N6KDF3_MONLA|nr:hypothetical protein EYC80_003315 [Monilinia laxa]